ncbi:DUF885 family protein [Streptomyces sp. NPDC048172]|uniref:DUF885 family protein n=1 Tax=Streptomyces sp. NPDC048172 TaxID=3365505 RepID=UPI00370FB31F
MDHRLRAICALSVPRARETAGHHAAYDGTVQDLSPEGVRAGLAVLTPALPYADPYDEAVTAAAEDALRVRFGELELHRRNPRFHLENLDVACYDRDYAPEAERAAARAAHLGLWPDAVDAALKALDAVPAPVARATLPAARALGAYAEDHPAARAAHGRLVAHLEDAALHGDPSAALGGASLGLLLSSSEACEADLAELARRAEAERETLHGLLRDACGTAVSTAESVRALQADHPAAEDLLDEARTLAEEARAWTAASGLVPPHCAEGACEVRPAPASRRSVLAGLRAAAPYERDAPSVFHLTPPGPGLPEAEREQWLSVFHRAFLPAFVLHEVAPGHFTHGRALRRVTGDVRRTLHSEAFTEGWAVYAEQLALEEGFLAHDRRFAAGVALSGLQRATRLSCAIGLHTGALTVADAVHAFEREAFLTPPAARAEADRALWDPEYGHYTWGKLALLGVRERARLAWGPGFSLLRFHSALLALGAPPLGLMDAVLEQG